MFELTPQNIAILMGLAVAAFYIWKMSNSSARTEYAEDMSKDQLKALVYSLAKNLKDSKEEDERLRQKIEDLQFADSLQREQTKFLTANVNKTTSVL
jgi:gas vesicle protein